MVDFGRSVLECCGVGRIFIQIHTAILLRTAAAVTRLHHRHMDSHAQRFLRQRLAISLHRVLGGAVRALERDRKQAVER